MPLLPLTQSQLKLFVTSLNDEGSVEIKASQFTSMEAASASHVADVLVAEFEEEALALKSQFPLPSGTSIKKEEKKEKSGFRNTFIVQRHVPRPFRVAPDREHKFHNHRAM
jgi:hypothetical protein